MTMHHKKPTAKAVARVALNNEQVTRQHVIALEAWKADCDTRLQAVESQQHMPSLLARLKWLVTGRQESK